MIKKVSLILLLTFWVSQAFAGIRVHDGTTFVPVGTGSKTIVTEVGTPGTDANIPTEQAVREAIEAGGGTGTDDQTAAEVPITDTSTYFIGTDVEAALQEIGPTMTDARTPTSHGNEAHSTAFETADATIIKESELSSATDSTSTTTAANSAAVKAVADSIPDTSLFMKIHVLASEPDQTTKDSYADYTEGYVIQ